LAYLFLSDSGNETGKGLKKKIKEIAKDTVTDIIQKKAKFSKKVSEAVANEAVK